MSLTISSLISSALKNSTKLQGAEQKINFLAQEIFGLSYSDLFLKKEMVPGKNQVLKFKEAIDKLNQNVPEAYILGYQYFLERKFIVSKSTLIPRPETEQLVNMVVKEGKSTFNNQYSFLDVGTGSGCIGLSVLLEEPSANGVLLDISLDALNIAKQNAKLLGVKNTRVDFVVSGATDYRPKGQFDFILANPPYIAKNDVSVSLSTIEQEPHLALYSEDQGLRDIKEWMTYYEKFMSKKSFMIFEIGCGQGAKTKAFANNLNVFSRSTIVMDEYGKDRFFIGEK